MFALRRSLSKKLLPSLSKKNLKYDDECGSTEKSDEFTTSDSSLPVLFNYDETADLDDIDNCIVSVNAKDLLSRKYFDDDDDIFAEDSDENVSNDIYKYDKPVVEATSSSHHTACVANGRALYGNTVHMKNLPFKRRTIKAKPKHVKKCFSSVRSYFKSLSYTVTSSKGTEL